MKEHWVITQKPMNVVIARLGPFGPMVQIGEKSDESSEKKPRFASLQKGQTIQNISLETALDLFKLPRSVGYYKIRNYCCCWKIWSLP